MEKMNSKLSTHKASEHSKRKDDDIKFLCIHCNHIIAAPAGHKGNVAKCCYCDTFITTPEDDFSPNTIIDDDFVVIRLLGTGSSGKFYRAHQISLDRACVLKVLHDKNKSHSSLLHKEARIMAQLIHNNIIQCYAIGNYHKFTYYAMEYIRGGSLEDFLYDYPILRPGKALNIITQITEALNYAFQHYQLVHYDITPKNIMINKDGIAKINDFNLSSVLPNEPDAENKQKDEDKFSDFTCPENILGMGIGYEGNMYSLGVIFYLMVTGHMPYSAQNRIELMKKHISDLPVPPKLYAPELPDDFIKVISKLMARFPADRYSDYNKLLEDLMQLEAKHNIKQSNTITASTKRLARIYLTNSSPCIKLPTEINLDFQMPQTVLAKKRKRIFILYLALTVILILIAISLFYFQRQ